MREIHALAPIKICGFRLGSFGFAFLREKGISARKVLQGKGLGAVLGDLAIGFVLGSNWVRMGSFSYPCGGIDVRKALQEKGLR